MRRRKHLGGKNHRRRRRRYAGMAGRSKTQRQRLQWWCHAVSHQQAKRAVIQHRGGGRVTGCGVRGGGQCHPARSGAGANFNQRRLQALRPVQRMRHRGRQRTQQRHAQRQPHRPGAAQPGQHVSAATEHKAWRLAQAEKSMAWLTASRLVLRRACRAWNGPWRQVCPCHRALPWPPAFSAPPCSRHLWHP